MKFYFNSTLLVIIILFSNNTYAQYKQVESTIKDYLVGTKTGDIDRIKSAFHHDATLYTIDGNDVKEIKLKDYLGFFEPGKVNTRKGEIVNIDIQQDAANAIVNVYFKGGKFTDYMILLDTKDGWKMIKKSYTAVPYDYKGRILFVLSNESTYGNSEYTTGAHFEEIIVPYDKLTKSGYIVDVVSPDGGAIPISYMDLSDSLQLDYFYNLRLMSKLKNSLNPDEVDVKKYKAIYFVGGSAAMYDLPNNANISELTRRIYEEENGVVAALCHGSAGLVNVMLSDGTYLVHGKTINSFTNEEESKISKNLLPFLLETKLRERGAIFKESKPGQSHVEVDGRIITGQNPDSSAEFIEKIVEQLKD